MRVFWLTSAALIGFSANSLLTRGALGTERIDPASFTAVRLLTGAIALALIVRGRPRSGADPGSWASGAALAAYAICFTLAYTRIGAGVGALVLFGSVQITMIGSGLARGERPGGLDWLGLLLAIGGLLVFTLPGAAAPDLAGTLGMTLAGAAWGVYSLAGRRSRDPLTATSGNFRRAAVFGVIVLAAYVPAGPFVTVSGVISAAASGALASGVAYTLWYSVLPSLPAWRAAIVQLLVPMLTAVAAALLLDEAITLRLAAATALVAAGVSLSSWPSRHRGRSG